MNSSPYGPLPSAVQTRIALAFLLQPFVAGLIALVAFPTVYYLRYADSPNYHIAGGLPLAVRMAIAVALASVPLPVVAFALFALLLKLRVRVGLRHALGAGALIGNVPLAVITSLNWAAQSRQGIPFDLPLDAALLQAVAFGAVMGLGCASVFWLTAGSPLRRL